MEITKIKKNRKDCQISGMAGEFLVAGKLFKRGYQVAITLGNAKSIDLFVQNPNNSKTFNVQVKTLRNKNCFPIRKESINPNYIYIFVILNQNEQNENFYILNGNEILTNIDNFFGSSYKKITSMPAINYGPLKKFENNWVIFDK